MRSFRSLVISSFLFSLFLFVPHCEVECRSQSNLGTNTIQNSVLIWNQFLSNNSLVRTYAAESREFALLYTGIHDALNTITQKYEFYLSKINVPNLSTSRIASANPDATVASVVYTLYNFIVPDRSLQYDPTLSLMEQSEYQPILDSLDVFYTSQLTALYDAANFQYQDNDDGEYDNNNNNRIQGIQDGLTIGVAAAQAIWNSRQNDGSSNSVADTSPLPQDAAPGQWYSNSVNPTYYCQWPYVTTWSVPNAKTFISPPALQLNDQYYIEELTQTKAYGGKESNVRTLAQTQSAEWFAALGQPSNNLASVILTRLGSDVWDSARVLALLHLAAADSMITTIDSQVTYNSWRPYQAIQNSVNSTITELAQLADESWEPYLYTPNNPEFPAGHPMVSGSGAEAAKLALGLDEFGESVSVVGILQNVPLPLPAQSFTSFSDFQEKVILARVYGGMHLKSSGIAGSAAGKQIARYITERYLRPV